MGCLAKEWNLTWVATERNASLKYLHVIIVCFYLLFSFVIKDGGFVYAANSVPKSEVSIITASADPLQILFDVGLNEVVEGNYSVAIAVFESLADKTQSPRVQLELARALFLDRRYRAAKKVFQSILQRPDIPWAVKENIRSYLDEINSALGFVKFGFSLVSDSNPRNFTDSRQVLIAGQPLKIIPPEDNKEIIGVRYSVSAAMAFTEVGSLMGYLNASYSDFEGAIFDRWSADIGLIMSVRSLPRLGLRIGIEESFYAEDHLYEFPYIGFIFTPQPAYQFRFNSELKIGQLRVPNASHYEATNISLTTKATKKATTNIYTSGDIYLEKFIADEDAYSYYGGSLGVSLNFVLLQGWGLKPFSSLGRRIYESDDPFFGETRHDTRKMLGITIKKSDWVFFGYTPEVGISYEENTSNLDYYSYDKLNITLKFN